MLTDKELQEQFKRARKQLERNPEMVTVLMGTARELSRRGYVYSGGKFKRFR